jgi:hypothetical protein
MKYDPVKDCTMQYRQFIAAGLPHDVAIHHVEMRLGQSREHEEKFYKALNNLAENQALSHYWRTFHAPFRVWLPLKKAVTDDEHDPTLQLTYAPPDTRGYFRSWAQRNGHQVIHEPETPDG